jgi:hypothetical protein
MTFVLKSLLSCGLNSEIVGTGARGKQMTRRF